MDIIISISFISSAKVHPRVTGGKRKENGEEEKRGGRGGWGVGVGGAGGVWGWEGRVGVGVGGGLGKAVTNMKKTDNNCGPIHGCITYLSLWSVSSRTGTAPRQIEDTPSE